MNEPFDVRDLVEVSRAALASMGSNVDAASGALSAILAAGSRGLFDVWDAIDEQIGKAEAPGLRERLIELRARFAERAGAAEVGRLEKVLAQSPGRRLDRVADRARQFDLPFSGRTQRAAGSVRPRASGAGDEASEVVRAVQCMRQGRWPEAYDQIEKLSARPFLPTELRARLLGVLGLVQLFHFRKFGSARRLLEAAEALAPRDVRVIAAMGDYWMHEGAPDRTCRRRSRTTSAPWRLRPRHATAMWAWGTSASRRKISRPPRVGTARPSRRRAVTSGLRAADPIVWKPGAF